MEAIKVALVEAQTALGDMKTQAEEHEAEPLCMTDEGHASKRSSAPECIAVSRSLEVSGSERWQ